MEQLAKATADQLAAATAVRDDFVRESQRLEAESRSLSEAMKATLERLSFDKKEVDAFDERLKALAKAVGETEARMQGVLTMDTDLTAMQREADALAKAFTVLTANADELAHKQSLLDSLAGQLAQVDASASAAPNTRTCCNRRRTSRRCAAAGRVPPGACRGRSAARQAGAGPRRARRVR
jgi:chromosome segregation ATPase